MKIFKSKTARIFLGMLFVMLVLALVCSSCSGSSSTPSSTSTPKEGAWYSCTLFIERQYDISYLKAENYRASKVQVGDENPALYGIEIFYPEGNQTFNCIVQKVEDGYHLVYLEPK